MVYLIHPRKTFKEELVVFYREDSQRRASYPLSKSSTKEELLIFYRKDSQRIASYPLSKSSTKDF